MAKKQNRSDSQAETLTVRMSPRTKYGLELIARSQRRSLASVAEWLFVEGMRYQEMTSLLGEVRPVANVLSDLWDPYEADRLVKLAQRYPSLLTYDEEKIWKVIRKVDTFWMHRNGAACDQQTIGDIDAKECRDYPSWEPLDNRIREQWDKIKAAAHGEAVDFTQSNKEG